MSPAPKNKSVLVGGDVSQHRNPFKSVLHLDHQLGPRTSLEKAEETRWRVLAGAGGAKVIVLIPLIYVENHVNICFRHARRHGYSAGRPCWTKTERQGLVDGALGPANGVRDVSTSQAPTAVAARDGAEPIVQATVWADVQLAAGVIEAD